MVVARDGAGETGNEELLFKGWRALVLQDKNSSGVCVCVCVCVCARMCACSVMPNVCDQCPQSVTLWTVDCQAPISMGFSRQE